MEGVGEDIKVTVVLKRLINLHTLQAEPVKERWGFSTVPLRDLNMQEWKWSGIEQLYFLGMQYLSGRF